jgi:hypothetical protein
VPDMIEISNIYHSNERLRYQSFTKTYSNYELISKYEFDTKLTNKRVALAIIIS